MNKKSDIHINSDLDTGILPSNQKVLILKKLIVVDVDKDMHPGYFIGLYENKYYHITIEQKYKIGDILDFKIVVSHLEIHDYEVSIDYLKPWIYEVFPVWNDAKTCNNLWRFPKN